MDNWTTLRFFESSSNLRAAMERATGERLSATRAREVGICLQQGRLFYAAADASEMPIRPLIQFYGTLALAKALVIARTGSSLSSMPQTHGLSDASGACQTIADLRVRLDAAENGMFQRFNDVAAQLTGLSYFRGTTPEAITIPSTNSAKFKGLSLSIRELLARIPGLHDLYQQTYHEPALSAPIQVEEPTFHSNWVVRVDDPENVASFGDVIGVVTKWRARFPFLANWRLTTAQPAWGNAALLFENEMPEADELHSEGFCPLDGGGFQARRPASVGEPARDISTVLPPLAGRFSGYATAIAPIADGLHLNEHSLHYAALYLLSSLVRYRPNVWVHAISRSVTDSVPADDAQLAVIEEFLTRNALETPQFIAGALIAGKSPSAERTSG